MFGSPSLAENPKYKRNPLTKNVSLTLKIKHNNNSTQEKNHSED